MTDSKLAAFSTQDLVYSHINGHDMMATVLTPKLLQGKPPSDYPVLVYWHGGGFITGHRTYAPWWPKWSIEFALSRNSIIVSPDYRLLPEASGSDILDDIRAFWEWMKNDFISVSERERWHARPNLGQVACMGESSGGYLALQSALLGSSGIDIKVVITISAPLDGDICIKRFGIPSPRMILGSWPPPPRRAEAIIRDYIRAIKPGTVRTEGDPVAMWPLLMCIVQQARMPRLFGYQKNILLNATAMIDQANKLPPMWIIHSEQDSLVSLPCRIPTTDKALFFSAN
ncbi:unnamed protein product [Periconia digitata]|uniref:Alpha/beta hydrolase fold-3 domain-containing protein n=1 Tax=Periconia digitata TaxID=1303443 RepID=A0A9W4XP59_9PLEO|nr:unnamed protein product [Periconia digitata]